MGQKNFRTLSTRANVLTKLNRLDEAKKTMEEALPMGTIQDVHFYGRELITQNRADEAMKVFKMNYDRSPKEYTTNIGMARAFSAKGDYKKTLTHLKVALPGAPDDGARRNIENLMKRAEEGKDINQ